MMTPTEEGDLQIAREAYDIYRRQHFADFPHTWEGLPQHYRDFLFFLVAHARTPAPTAIRKVERQPFVFREED